MAKKCERESKVKKAAFVFDLSQKASIQQSPIRKPEEPPLKAYSLFKSPLRNAPTPQQGTSNYDSPVKQAKLSLPDQDDVLL